MKIRCKNCYRVLNENEDYCTNCGEYSQEMAEFMKTGVRKMSLGYNLKVALIFFAFIAFIGTGVFSISTSVIQGFIDENSLYNVLSKLITSMALIIGLTIVFRKELLGVILKDNLFVTLKELIVGTFYIIISYLFVPNQRKKVDLDDFEIDNLKVACQEALKGKHSTNETKELKALVNDVKKLIDSINKLKGVSNIRLSRTSSYNEFSSGDSKSLLILRKKQLILKYNNILKSKRALIKSIYNSLINDVLEKNKEALEKEELPEKKKALVEKSNEYKEKFKSSKFRVSTLKLFGSIFLGILAISSCVIISTLSDITKIIPNSLINFIPEGKVGFEFVILLFVIMLVSVCEEYIYRHRLINYFDEETMLNDFWTIALSVIISTVLSFSWFMSLDALIMTFFINIIMSLLYINTNRSLSVNIVIRLLMYLGVLILNMYI